MIKIGYASVPQEYFDYISRFKGKIQKWYEKGEMGNGKTKVDVCWKCKVIFRYLKNKDNLKKYLLVPADKLPDLIQYIERKYPELKDDREGTSDERSELYVCLSKAFDVLGYRENDFPDFALCSSIGVKACPYCNEEDIITYEIKDEDVKIRNSELDHFYPREKHPYLSISLYNLIPSGSICNGGHCKHHKDVYKEQLVNPFSLSDSEGIRFELDVIEKGLMTYSTFEKACRIKTLVIDKRLASNANMFLIAGRYKEELDQAKFIWALHFECGADGYRKAMEEKSKKLGLQLTFEDWFYSETQVDPRDYNKRKLSKLSVDIWRQAENGRM